MPRLAILILLALAARLAAAADLVIVVGAPGMEEFTPRLAEAAEAWEEAGRRGEATLHRIGRDGDEGDDGLATLGELIPELAGRGDGPLWIVLLGHGTFDGREAKFNLRGPDLSAATLAGWLEGSKRPVAIINGTASSAPFLKTLSGSGRVVVTATKNGAEDSYARFGEFLARMIDDPAADRDQDGAVSLLEGFLAASARVEEFYEEEGRLVTEEALLDDNGDGFGTPADWFRGVRAERTTKDGAEPDGRRAHQIHLVPSEEERRLDPETRARRNALEEELFELRGRREAMDEAAYFEELERIVRELSELYAAAAEDS